MLHLLFVKMSVFSIESSFLFLIDVCAWLVSLRREISARCLVISFQFSNENLVPVCQWTLRLVSVWRKKHGLEV